MLSRLLHFIRQRDTAPEAARDDALFTAVADRFPALLRWIEADEQALRDCAHRILDCKRFQGANGFEPSAADCLAVALLAALPVRHIGLDLYSDFHTFILYPSAFFAEIEEVDEDGLVHSGRDLRAGEAWAHGPVVLAMDDVWASAQGEGFNVVVHELAHQIDQRNGASNGFPPLPAGMDPSAWTRAFSAAFARLNEELEQGREPSLDPYAAESPAEFFAVACEFYFDVPEWLAEQYPEITQYLDRLFGHA